MRTLRRCAALSLLLLVPACDTAGAVEVIGCSIEDEKLGVAFRDPAKAKRYLEILGERLGESEPDAIREAADLVSRVAECLQ